MSACQSCGGVIGRDCWNPQECAQITAQMEMDRLASPPADQPAKETCFGLSGIALMGGLEDQPADHIGEANEMVERTMSGETVGGLKVAAWRYHNQSDDPKYGHRYCEHWSTPGAGAKNVERLFTEDQVRDLLSLIARQEETIRGHEEAAMEPLADNPAVAAMMDSSYRAGALAGWNAAHEEDPNEGERIMARIRSVEPGSLRPIIDRNQARARLSAHQPKEPK